ncbi:MAG TPA: TetR/AcrR family transcriptional regulator, partial [Burkholderiaceae bacterium]|nr:TetR/AcrR family transcriptional regulator [Burkholderiaceae bacterium]
RQGQDAGRIDPALDVDAASTLYAGMVHGPAIRSLASGETASLTLEAPKVFALFRRGVERRP